MAYENRLQDAMRFCLTGAETDKKSDAANFVLVMPQGYNNSWNAGTVCGDASNERAECAGVLVRWHRARDLN
jgi:hypothetical protein